MNLMAPFTKIMARENSMRVVRQLEEPITLPRSMATSTIMKLTRITTINSFTSITPTISMRTTINTTSTMVTSTIIMPSITRRT